MFPGIGYHCDKPLLYYGKKLEIMYEYTDCISLSYSYDGKNIRGNSGNISKATQKIKKKYYCCTAWWVSGIIIQVYIAEKNCCSWEAGNNERVETNDDAGSRE